jgi:phosphopantetheinyl transferase
MMERKETGSTLAPIEVACSGGGILYLHLAHLDQLTRESAEDFHAITIPEEHARAKRFIKPIHQQRFLASRYFLRKVLSEHTGEDPIHIRIGFTEHEKPFLCDHSLPFNLSHSGEFAVVGITRSGNLGVDIETRDTLETAIQVSPRIMTSDEHTHWQTLPDNQKMDTFLKYWTLKEAILKAHGQGLLQDPRGIELELTEQAESIRSLAPVFSLLDQWQVGFVDPPGPYPRVAWARQT